MAEHPVVLCIHDTTELNFNGQNIVGLGRLSYEAQRGMYLHPTYAVTPDREPLGVTDAWMWARPAKGVPGFLCKVTAIGRKIFPLQRRTIFGQRCRPKIGWFGESTADHARSIARDPQLPQFLPMTGCP